MRDCLNQSFYWDSPIKSKLRFMIGSPYEEFIKKIVWKIDFITLETLNQIKNYKGQESVKRVSKRYSMRYATKLWAQSHPKPTRERTSQLSKGVGKFPQGYPESSVSSFCLRGVQEGWLLLRQSREWDTVLGSIYPELVPHRRERTGMRAQWTESKRPPEGAKGRKQ